MEKIIYHGCDITEVIARKEKKIVELYSQERKTPFNDAMQIYLRSTLMAAIRDVENDLWTQSEYYIIEAYSSYLDMTKVKMDKEAKKTEKEKPEVVIRRTKRPGIQHKIEVLRRPEKKRKPEEQREIEIRRNVEDLISTIIAEPVRALASDRYNAKKKEKIGDAMVRSTNNTKVKR